VIEIINAGNMAFGNTFRNIVLLIFFILIGSFCLVFFPDHTVCAHFHGIVITWAAPGGVIAKNPFG
jgi:hypothetical protein